jgi:hypothetical protein
MDSRLRRWYCAVVVVAAIAAACKTNPVANLAGVPAALSIAPTAFHDSIMGTITVTVKVLDKSFSPIVASVSATSSAPGVASVGPAVGVLPDPSGTSTTFGVTGVAAGTAVIHFTSSGITDSATVTVP